MAEEHFLENWKQYLNADDYYYIIQYVENIKNNIPNDKMIILSGKGRVGKTFLKNNISQYLGEELCGECPISGDLIYNENIKRLGFFCGIDEIDKAKKNVPAILNFIKYIIQFQRILVC